MPAILGQTAILLCPHGGTAQPIAPAARARISGSPILTMASGAVVSGCSLAPSQGGPCGTVRFVTGAARVSSSGAAVLVQTSICTSETIAAPLTVIVAQSRVKAV